MPCLKFVLVFSLTLSCAFAELHVPLEEFGSKVIRSVKIASDIGLCSQEVYEAGEYLKTLVLSNASLDYQKGNAHNVWLRNEVQLKWNKMLNQNSAKFSSDRNQFHYKIMQLDKTNPPSLFRSHNAIMDKAALDGMATYDGFEEALKSTGGNAFRAATIIGMIAHDDVNFVSSDSNLFAPKSMGVTPNRGIFERFKKASTACVAVHGSQSTSDDAACPGAGHALNYHMNYGLFLGCQLAKNGFGKASISKLFTDALVGLSSLPSLVSDKVKMIETLNDPFIHKDLACRKVTGVLNQQYCIDLCTDVPKMLGHFYKRITMEKFLTDDAKVLFNKGYRTAFMAEENKFKRPAKMTEDDWKKAVANLDYRLMHLEYGAELARAGAEKGARKCSRYKESVKPKSLSKEAALLYDRGNFNPSRQASELKRVPKDLKGKELNDAWEELKSSLRESPDKYDYWDELTLSPTP
jgi:hypothetical protein